MSCSAERLLGHLDDNVPLGATSDAPDGQIQRGNLVQRNVGHNELPSVDLQSELRKLTGSYEPAVS